jgi:hypothetical protein
MSRVRTLLVVAVTAGALAGCEQLFTTNAFSALQRDPSNLSFDQQISYAESALSSGDEDAMADAYDALSDSLEDENNDDPDLNSLAAELAIGASGLPGTIPDLADAAINGDLSDKNQLADAVNDKLGDVDYGYVDEAVRQLEEITANGGEVTAEQYVFVAAGLIMKDGAANGGIENLDGTAGQGQESSDFIDDAIADLQGRGEASDLLDDMANLYP